MALRRHRACVRVCVCDDRARHSLSCISKSLANVEVTTFPGHVYDCTMLRVCAVKTTDIIHTDYGNIDCHSGFLRYAAAAGGVRG